MNNPTSLEKLAQLNATDKYDHGYMPLYDTLFSPFRYEGFRILEIGFAKGRGARTLAEYFPRVVIHSIDYQYTPLDGFLNLFPDDLKSRVRLWKADQGNEEDLRRVMNEITRSSRDSNPKFKIIIDDGCHVPDYQLISFKFFWPFLEAGGYYVIEDMHPAYENGAHKTIDYFINEIHKINKNGDIKKKSDSDIEWIMFPYNRIVIRKKNGL